MSILQYVIRSTVWYQAMENTLREMPGMIGEGRGRETCDDATDW
ncbi:MAG: hypothetical protein ACLRQR_10960 [Merdimonas faecis]|nr:hypothetical protein [Merdimonas faecis]